MNNSEKTKKKQNQLLAACILAVAAVGLFTWFIGAEETAKPKEEELLVHDLSKDLADERFWMWDYSGRVKTHEQQIADLENKLANNEEKQRLEKLIKESNDKNDELLSRIAKLEERQNYPVQINRKTIIASNQQQKTPQANNNEDETMLDDMPEYNGSNKGGYSHNANIGEPQQKIGHSFQVHNFNLQPIGKKNNKNNIKDTIPSNSFIKAILLNGVDISAGETSQQNPQPVILRVTGWGNLPNGHKLRGLKQCRIHAVAWGDLSSERVYMQPDLLTCVSENGDIVETTVEGHVAANDGKLGIRGHMITRDADLVKSAMLAGTLSGLGETMASSQGTTSVSPLGSTRTFNGKEALTSSLGKGAGKGLDMVAEYKIKQAERLQPIIQVSGGLEVEVLFFASSKLGKTTQKIALEKEEGHEKQVLDTINEINQRFGEKQK